VRTEAELRDTLRRLDGRGYKAYKDLRGAYDFGALTLFIDHVQGDPFAAPSKLRLRLAQSEADWPKALQASAVRRLAFADLLARRFRDAIAQGGGSRQGSGKSGVVQIDAGGQEVLERSAARVDPAFVEVRCEAGLPAQGRRVLGRAAEALLCDTLPALANDALAADDSAERDAIAFVLCIENQEHLRSQLEARGLVAFVGDGAILPRESGASDRPLRRGAVPFEAPETLRVELPLANPTTDEDGTARHHVSGLGIPAGVTLIVGGGYHGKSTLLRAIERGVYPHIPGDGREWVVAHPDLVKIRAEDGRRVERVDIGAFVSDLPGGRTTHDFQSDDASGSTSQAANIVEAIEAGAHGLLLDEDTCATNFMLRDARMQALVHPDHEPITPFVDRVGELARGGLSTVLVMGGCGDYFDVADHVIRMHDFRPEDATAEAKRIAGDIETARKSEAPTPMTEIAPRIPLCESFDASRGRRDVKIDVKARDLILYGRERIDLRAVEQLVDPSQTRAIAHAIHHATEHFIDGNRSLSQVLDELEAHLDAVGLDPLDPYHHEDEHPGRYARPRRHELAATINRLRTLRVLAARR
jgi:predicted ABC-class ATPase